MTSASRRPILRLLKWVALGLVALLLLLIVAGAIWEQVERARIRKAYPPPGRLVDIGGRKMHIDCRGQGSPTIILESGLDSNGSLAWDAVHDAIARETRTCAYDRAGVMWSDPKPGPQNADLVADDLHALLAAARIEGPIVLVGHSLGGPYSMAYVRKYGDQVKGLVFVDTSHPEQQRRLPAAIRAVNDKMQDMYATQRLMSRFAWTGIPRLMTDRDAQDPQGIPMRVTRIGAEFAPTTLEGTVKEGESLSRSLAQGGQLRDLGDRPLIVLGAQKVTPDLFKAFGMTAQDAVDFVESWKVLISEEAGWSSRSRLILLPDAGHYVQFDRPDVVIAAAKEVVETVRRDQAGAKK